MLKNQKPGKLTLKNNKYESITRCDYCSGAL